MITRAMKEREISRELAVRQQVFPRWVEAKRLSQHEADRRIAILEAILADYRAREDDPDQTTLF